jgi:hypothetical protein
MIFFSIIIAYVIISYGWMFDMFFRRYPGDRNVDWFGRFLWWLASPLWAAILAIIFVIEQIVFWWMDRK